VYGYLRDDGGRIELSFKQLLKRAVLWMLDQFLYDDLSGGIHPDFLVPDDVLLKALADSMGTTPDRIGTDADWPVPEQRALLAALVLLVERYFWDTDGVMRHSFMSAEEAATEVLERAGLMTPAHGGGRWTPAGDAFRLGIWDRQNYLAWINRYQDPNPWKQS